MVALHHPEIPLAEFGRARPKRIGRNSRGSRFAGSVMTSLLLLLFGSALLAITNRQAIVRHAACLCVMIDRETPRPVRPEPPSLARMIGLHAVTAEAPLFTIQPENDMPVGTGTSLAAPAGSGAAPANGGGKAAACIDPAYLAQLSAHIASHFHYPLLARLDRSEGVVLLHFISDRSGKILSVSIARSSGIPALDYDALALLRRSEPLPPMPAKMRAETLDAELPIAYRISARDSVTTGGNSAGAGCN